MNERALGLDRLEHVKQRGTKIIARCPACAASGADNTGEHLVIFGSGKWGCIAFAGDKEHRRQIAAIAGIAALPNLRPPPRRPVQTARRALVLPALRVPTVGELATIARLRGLPFYAGLELAARAGHLRMADLRDGKETVRAWVLVDSSARNAQARRLDGKLWQSIDAKAKTLPGSQAAWPIGAADIGDKPNAALCEGGPDTLAAWSFAWWHDKAEEIAPCCMTGAGQRIHADALPLFRGKGVFLCPHRDKAGERAADVWTEQLRDAGAKWVRTFNVAPAKDLNELLAIVAGEMGDDEK